MATMPETIFADQVRDALNHLHERAVLGTHPLGRALAKPGQPVSGPALRQAILDAIEQLRPEGDATRFPSAWRRYRHLVLRYVDGQSFEAILHSLAISERQAYRDHAEALAALTRLLWSQNLGPLQPLAQDITNTASPTFEEELSRLRPTADEEPAPLAATLRGVLDTVAGFARQRGVSFDARLPVNLPLVAVGRTILRQISLRLLMHLIEAHPGARVAIDVESFAERVVVHWRINGIPPACRGAPSGCLVDGLALAQRLVAMHGGSLTVDDPAAPIVADLTLVTATAPTILVVDDNPDVIRLFSLYLDGRGYRVVQATNAAGALRLAREIHPDVITLDILMPSLDGWEFLRDVRADPETCDLPVIICSIVPDPDLARSFGVAATLSKPVTRAKLLAILGPLMMTGPGGVTGYQARP